MDERAESSDIPALTGASDPRAVTNEPVRIMDRKQLRG